MVQLSNQRRTQTDASVNCGILFHPTWTQIDASMQYSVCSIQQIGQ